VCTRACAFCNVATGKPDQLDPHEPENTAKAVAGLGMAHIVITSVDRDDLGDGGAMQFVRTIEEIRARSPGTTIEILTPDFLRKDGALEKIVAARPDVVAYYRHTHCPDESFLHTVVVNTPGLRIDVNPFRHVSWGNRLFPTHPLCVTRGPLLDAAIASGMPFARKFDIEVDAACLDILDLRISAREPIGEAHA